MKVSRTSARYVRLYTRPNCGLCANAEYEIDKAALQINFRKKMIDITKLPENQEWYDKYAFDVPVVQVSRTENDDPDTIFMHRLTSQALVDAVQKLEN